MRDVCEGQELIGIVIVAQGGLAQAYLESVEHIVGPLEGACAVSIEDTCDRAVQREQVCDAVRRMDAGTGVIVATDLHGSSPANLAVDACGQSNRRVLFGANLPMLVALARSRGLALDEATANAVDAGRKYIACSRGSEKTVA